MSFFSSATFGGNTSATIICEHYNRHNKHPITINHCGHIPTETFSAARNTPPNRDLRLGALATTASITSVRKCAQIMAPSKKRNVMSYFFFFFAKLVPIFGDASIVCWHVPVPHIWPRDPFTLGVVLIVIYTVIGKIEWNCHSDTKSQ